MLHLDLHFDMSLTVLTPEHKNYRRDFLSSGGFQLVQTPRYSLACFVGSSNATAHILMTSLGEGWRGNNTNNSQVQLHERYQRADATVVRLEGGPPGES